MKLQVNTPAASKLKTLEKKKKIKETMEFISKLKQENSNSSNSSNTNDCDVDSHQMVAMEVYYYIL